MASMRSFPIQLLAGVLIKGIFTSAGPVSSSLAAEHHLPARQVGEYPYTPLLSLLTSTQLTGGNVADLFDLLDDSAKQDCEDNPDKVCGYVAPNELARVIPVDGGWGCTLCPGQCPDGDYAQGGRPSHPDLIPEVQTAIPGGPSSYAPGECGIHAVIYPQNWDSRLTTPLVIDHIDIDVKDANTKQLINYIVGGDVALNDPTGVFITLIGGNFLIIYAKTGYFSYAGENTSFDGSKTIPGVQACSAGDPDENGVAQIDCGFHCF